MYLNSNKYLIFGAGFYGQKALEQYGSQNVDFFIDNDSNKIGTFCNGKEIITPARAAELAKESRYQVIIASLYAESMAAQLDELGVTEYTFFISPIHGMYETEELIVNPYLQTKEAESEKEWSDSQKIRFAREEVNKAVERLHRQQGLFNHIEIETINRCNGICSFCPVNRNDDPREKAVMSVELFKDIIGQLEEMQYSGRLTTFSNNEPLLDDRIIEFNKYAKEHLPKARIHMYTNGTLFTLDKFKELVEVLDELIIDNYNQELQLIKPVKEIVEYCEAHPELELNKKVTVVLRKPQEILTNRGGNAPNRKEFVEYPGDRCLLPYKQMIVRPTGQVSLCCNDALGKWTLGDLTKESILDVWYGTKFTKAREALYKGRQYCGDCRLCDTFSMG
ncbi:radical SAM/SPASM domain-containing protein [Butyrivibrio proteoclasticus]|uniref:radical SAM/SPASM domain-containing protein n=1 Tax=Butyrivibrio proteoclasticus TaxID=43305 RepID=UPI000AB4C4AA|nr:radical SAM/SPASM domain-containing protein [Butyrivibrio proteoclasticus]